MNRYYCMIVTFIFVFFSFYLLMTLSNQYFFNLSKKYLQSREGVKYIRKKWNEKADKEFFKNNFYCIHWGQKESIKNFLKYSNPEVEVCAQAYMNNNFNCRWVGGIGVMIEGDITLAGNDDLQTNQWSSITKEDGKKYTWAVERLIFDEKSTGTGEESMYEFILGKWESKKIVFDFDKISIKNPDKLEKLVHNFSRFNLPLIDSKGRELDAENMDEYFYIKNYSHIDEESEGEDYGYIKESESWGKKGAGILVYNSSTMEILLLKRSPKVSFEPKTWGVPGGAVKKGVKDSLITAVAESKEEMKNLPEGRIRKFPYVYKKEGTDFTYDTYILETSEDFRPELNWENTNFMWTRIDQIPKNIELHPGVKELLDKYKF